ncbi:MAG: TPM domain-containing protein [Oscillospiraceae bacterium]|nr:TPM domain-containing protein [Oscillospiraceae bacterium]
MKQAKRLAAALLCALLLTFTAALAVADAPADGYINDAAGVISSETEEYINGKVDALSQRCGAQIAIAAVDFFDGLSSEDYAYQVFNSWGVGDKNENNGLLLVFAVGENKVWAMCGTGLERSLGPKLETYLEDYFYDEYDAENYDSAVRGWFDAVYGWFDSYSLPGYQGGSTGVQNPGDAQPPIQQQGGFATAGAVITVLIVVVVLVVVFDSMRYTRYRRRYLLPGMPPPPFVYRPFSSLRIKKQREVKNFCRHYPAGPRRIGLAQSSGKSTLPTKE